MTYDVLEFVKRIVEINMMDISDNEKDAEKRKLLKEKEEQGK